MSTTAEKIAVMQAFERGEQIESTGRLDINTWFSDSEPVWNWSQRSYRVKPKPLEFSFIVDKNGSSPIHAGSDAESKRRCADWDKKYPLSAPHRVVLMREVTP